MRLILPEILAASILLAAPVGPTLAQDAGGAPDPSISVDGTCQPQPDCEAMSPDMTPGVRTHGMMMRRAKPRDAVEGAVPPAPTAEPPVQPATGKTPDAR